MDNISNSKLLEAMSELYDKNVADIKKGLYGKYIKTNDDGTFLVQDKVLSKTLKITDNTVLWKDFRFVEYETWKESIPVISIKDSRYEQDFFENNTQIVPIDEIFQSPDYVKFNRNKIAAIEYMSPMEYIELCAIGQRTTISRQVHQLREDDIISYANSMLKNNKFPMISLEYKENILTNQEGRHRAMAIQHLIDIGKIPEDTLIPVVIVTEV